MINNLSKPIINNRIERRLYSMDKLNMFFAQHLGIMENDQEYRSVLIEGCDYDINRKFKRTLVKHIDDEFGLNGSALANSVARSIQRSLGNLYGRSDDDD